MNQSMIKAICISVLLFFLCLNTKAQNNFIVAGQHSSSDYYHDINPDTIMNTNHNIGISIYNLDLDGDSYADFKVTNTCGCAGLDYKGHDIDISALNSSGKIAFSQLGICGDSLIRAFNIGDSIKESDTLIWSNVLHVYKSDWWIGGGPNCSEGIMSTFPYSTYIGLRLTTASDTLYGWLNILIDSETKIVLKEYGCNKNINTNVVQQSDFSEQISIYLNSSTNKVQVTTGNNKLTLINIYDVVGKEMISTKEKEIDVSSFPNGIYFVSVKTKEGVITKKIIVQR
jgi:hypothetical protein